MIVVLVRAWRDDAAVRARIILTSPGDGPADTVVVASVEEACRVLREALEAT